MRLSVGGCDGSVQRASALFIFDTGRLETLSKGAVSAGSADGVEGEDILREFFE